jgi:1-acyl-sn-glycerol-3-phosphate acyltransferase
MLDDAARPDLLALGAGRLSAIEKAQIALVRRSFEPGLIDKSIRVCQRDIGSTWIHYSTRNLVRVHGLERLPELDPNRSFICVANHRSFFDLYVVTSLLVRCGLPHRILFPVRAEFFYTNPLGLFVNAVMSFLAMYPPLFRGRRRAALNLASLDELIYLVRRGGVFVGIHPEGTRKRDGDPYTFLPAQRGVGRLIARTQACVLPVFIHGLLNDLPRQVRSNFDGTGKRVHVVFGEPVDFGDLFEAPESPRLHQALADRCLESIGALGREERRLREEDP